MDIYWLFIQGIITGWVWWLYCSVTCQQLNAQREDHSVCMVFAVPHYFPLKDALDIPSGYKIASKHTPRRCDVLDVTG